MPIKLTLNNYINISSKHGVQWVHKDVNFMKQDYTDKNFINWCCRVADNYRSSIYEG